MKQYDLIVIGTGAANIVTDAAVQAGKSVALVERRHLGGTCLNHGCIPTKVLCSIADLVVESKKYESLGIKSEPLEANWDSVRERVFRTIEDQRGFLDEYYEKMEGLDLYRGTAKFIGNKELVVEDDGNEIAHIKGEKILVATGGRARVPDIDGIDKIKYLTSESFFDRETYPLEVPKSMILVGGGPIGIEFAHLFEAFGTKVTIIQRNVRLVPKSDEALSETIAAAFETRRIHTLFSQDAVSVEPTDQGVKLTTKHRDTGEEQTFEAETIFFSSGIESVNDLLDPKASGLELDDRGWIPTNEYLESNVPGIYVLGDANGLMQLRHKANYEAEILWHNLYIAKSPEEWRAADYRYVPYVTYSSPQMAQVGMTEADVKKAGISYEVSTLAYSDTAKGAALGFDDASAAYTKVILEKETEKILGVHIVGYQASILIQGYVYLMQAGADRAPELGDYASEEARRARAADTVKYSPNTASAINHAMTAHPSLGEVTAWAFSWNRWDQGIGSP